MSQAVTANLRRADDGAIREAARLLGAGGLVAFPTETVYGLGADAADGRAVARVFEAKGRPQFNPLIVHVAGRAEAERHAVFNAVARRLADALWPGALTLVLPRARGCRLSELVSAGLGTVALRVPAHPVAASLIAQSGLAIAAPSANASGRITATTAAHVAQSLGDKVDLILDGGATPLGLESTVIGFDGERCVLLRAGAIPRETIEAIAGPLAMPEGGTVQAPGQLASHYAPRAALRLNAMTVRPDEALLAFGPLVASGGRRTLNLSAAGDLREAAANLFAMLHALDASGAAAIAAMPIPRHGLGEAINDRLSRAAAPREAP
ncbi:MAG TPA: L-threonylcarbamoyladenylate synthase [Rhizomicrobium sp.]|jgi:L-threonylcarbamoyladenylate synthase|nr:L-threonylcarbamoyladenylate synthase [Rhizomicrobium sp.]